MLQRISEVLTIFFLAAAFTGCNSSKNTASDTNAVTNSKKQQKLFIRYEKTPCYGTCPVYVAEIYDNGTVHYNGQLHVSKTGEHTFELHPDVINYIRTQVQAMDFFNLQDAYKTEATDFPSTILTVHMDGKSKTVSHEKGGPEELIRLNRYIHNRIEKGISGDKRLDYRNTQPAQRDQDIKQ